MLQLISSKIVRIALYMVLILLSGCSGNGPEESGTVINAAVSVLPQKYFLEHVGGERVRVTVVVPPGANPATYEPTPSDMRSIDGADVWFTVGVAFETPWIPRFQQSNHELRVVSTVRNIEPLPIDRYSVESFISNGNHDDHRHDHGSPDPHVWLSPALVILQAEVMAEELTRMDSSGAGYYMANLRSFREEIDSLQAEMHSILDPLPRRSFIVFHPAWGYFADEFDLNMIPVESGGSEPSPREMSMLVDFAVSEGVSAIFVSPQFSSSSARTIASEIGGRVLSIDPLAEDWRDNLISAAETIAGTLTE